MKKSYFTTTLVPFFLMMSSLYSFESMHMDTTDCEEVFEEHL